MATDINARQLTVTTANFRAIQSVNVAQVMSVS